MSDTHTHTNVYRHRGTCACASCARSLSSFLLFAYRAQRLLHKRAQGKSEERRERGREREAGKQSRSRTQRNEAQRSLPKANERTKAAEVGVAWREKDNRNGRERVGGGWERKLPIRLVCVCEKRLSVHSSLQNTAEKRLKQPKQPKQPKRSTTKFVHYKCFSSHLRCVCCFHMIRAEFVSVF